MPAKLSEGLRRASQQSLVTHGNRLTGGLGARVPGLGSGLVAHGLRLTAPMRLPYTLFSPGDFRQFFKRSSAALGLGFDGAWRQFAAGEMRIVPSPVAGVPSVLMEVAATNKCVNFNANPPSLVDANKSGDAAATLTLVDDSAALAAAGLGGICTSGQVYCLNNSAGTSTAFAFPSASGKTGNTNAHTLSIYARAVGGAPSVCFSVNGAGTAAIPVGAGYARVVGTGVPAATSNVQLQTTAGGIIYFILNQLEEASMVTSPIITSGGTATRIGDLIAVPWARDLDQRGTISMSWEAPNAQGQVTRYYAFNLKDGGSDRLAVRAYDNGSGYPNGVVGDGTGNVTTPVGTNFTASNTAALAWDKQGTSFARNGGASPMQSGRPWVWASETAQPAVIGVGCDGVGNLQLNGYVREMRIWHRRLTDDELAIATQGA